MKYGLIISVITRENKALSKPSYFKYIYFLNYKFHFKIYFFFVKVIISSKNTNGKKE